jgi:hypothetical protein
MAGVKNDARALNYTASLNCPELPYRARVCCSEQLGLIAVDQRFTKQKLLELAQNADQMASRMEEPLVQETLRELATLYADLAKQIDELDEIRKNAQAEWLSASVNQQQP